MKLAIVNLIKQCGRDPAMFDIEQATGGSKAESFSCSPSKPARNTSKDCIVRLLRSTGALHPLTRCFSVKLTVVRLDIGGEVRLRTTARLKHGKGYARFRWQNGSNAHNGRCWKEEVMKQFHKHQIGQQLAGVDFKVSRDLHGKIISISCGTARKSRNQAYVEEVNT